MQLREMKIILISSVCKLIPAVYMSVMLLYSFLPFSVYQSLERIITVLLGEMHAKRKDTSHFSSRFRSVKCINRQDISERKGLYVM